MKTDKGLFLSFDGVPRSGRTHQADRLAESLHIDGHDVVRVSLDHGDTPMAKTDRAWFAGVMGRYEEIVDRDVVPALERGAIVIADSWITGVLVRAQAAANIPTSELLFAEERAMRLVPVDAEWIFPDAAPDERTHFGFVEACLARGEAKCSTPFQSFPIDPGLGARRRAMYIVRKGYDEKMAPIYAHQANAIIKERKDAKWHAIVEETQDQRDMARVKAYLSQWDGNAVPFIAVAAHWHEFSVAVRLAAVAAIPGVADERIITMLTRLPATSEGVDKAVASKIRRVRKALRKAAETLAN